MKKIYAIFGLVAFVGAASPASSQVMVEMSEITCKQFAGYDAATQTLVAAWMGGYFSAGRNLNVIQERYVDRNFEKITHYCKKHKNEPLLAVVEKVSH